MLRAALVIASIAWPLLLGAALWQRVHHRTPLLTSAVYMSASTICHRLPDRSFHTAGAQWPVCGRCSGLYLGAPVGAMIAIAVRRRRRGDSAGDAWLLALSSAPAFVTVALEWLHVYDVGNVGRLVTALPLGAAILVVIMGVVDRLAGHGAAGKVTEGRGQDV